jgi:hypothetical protein
VLDRADGLHAAGGEAAAAQGEQAEAALILTKDLERPGVLGRNCGAEQVATGGLKGGDGFGLFLCGWGAAP